MTDDQKKAIEGHQTMDHFFNMFGADIYSKVFLETFFEVLNETEIVSLFSEQEQEGNKSNHDPGIGETNNDPQP